MVSLADFAKCSGRTAPFRGAVFDFNGTLFWDTEFHDLAWIQSMAQYGVSLTREELFANFHGKPNDAIIRGLLGEDISETILREAEEKKERIYQEICLQNRMALAPGAEELLDFLKNRGFAFTVATSAPKVNVDFYFRTLGIGRWFDREMIVFFDGTFPGKPHPAFYQRALSMIGRTAEETVIFEDAPSGILAAENAECRNIVRVDSEMLDAPGSPYPFIRDFGELDRSLFE
ncbi:MAG: HAD family phosphatase [Thermoguttaceae bacterium]|nr:HAD family phosphatase [Thermoguttaceae bacterium]